MLKRKFTKLFLMLGVILLSMFTNSCSESNANSNQDSQDNLLIDCVKEMNMFDSHADIYEIVSLSLLENTFSSKIILLFDEKEIQNVLKFIINDRIKFIGEVKSSELDSHIICDSINLGVTAYSKELDNTICVSYLISQEGILYYYISDKIVKYTNENAVDYFEILDCIKNK